MLQLLYDGSMAGLLTAVFEAYERRAQEDATISPQLTAVPDAFAEKVEVVTDALKARRVWKGLGRHLSREALDQIYYCYLSEQPDAERHILSYINYAFAASGRKVEEDYGHASVLWVTQTARKVWREKHRMEAFVRFQELGDTLFYASIEPDYNVLPLIAKHFKSRYADQSWLIYDLRRKQGLHYDKLTEVLSEISLEQDSPGDMSPSPRMLAAHEQVYQALWQDYFKSTGIPARINPKLHLRHMPLRYWKHLTEKNV
jgi:probable DNA metabolism protein